MRQILVRNLDDETVSRLKRRAERHRRSLGQEVKLILEEASATVGPDPASVAERIRENLSRRGVKFTDSGKSQAEDRER